jgi:hypothetical protein
MSAKLQPKASVHDPLPVSVVLNIGNWGEDSSCWKLNASTTPSKSPISSDRPMTPSA